MRAFGDASAKNLPFGGRTLGARGAIASENYLSAQAGMDILKSGGNAFDAAAAAVFVESLVNPHMFTLGGECPILLYSREADRVVSVNGNTMAPKKCTLEAFSARGLDEVPPKGVLAAGPPAAPGALLAMLERYGSLPLKEITAPAVDLARNGFALHEGITSMPQFCLPDLAEQFNKEWKNSAELYLLKDKTAPQTGALQKNHAYALLLEEMAAHAAQAPDLEQGFRAAAKWFYNGGAAREIETFVKERNGFLTAEDMAAFTTEFEKPLNLDFAGYKIHKCGPWSQGPVFLQLLRLLEGRDLKALKHNSAEYTHLWVEAAKLAFADREQYYGDPKHTPVPVKELLSEEYAELRRTLLDMQSADKKLRPGDPLGMKALLPEQDVFLRKSWGYGTVHVAVADSFGNLAALTPSGGWLAGNDVVPALGFPLTTRLQTFYLDPRHPNCLAPRKRPRTTLTPSLALRLDNSDAADARPEAIAFGTMGGDQQDQWTNQFFLNMAVFEMALQEAIEAPKATSDHFPGTFHPHAASPGLLKLEGRFDDAVVDALKAKGHITEKQSDWSAGFICAVCRHNNGALEAGADPRGAKARVFPAQALAW